MDVMRQLINRIFFRSVSTRILKQPICMEMGCCAWATYEERYNDDGVLCYVLTCRQHAGLLAKEVKYPVYCA